MITSTVSSPDLYRFNCTAHRIATPGNLTDDDLRRYARDGFLAIENLMTASETEAAQADLTALLCGEVPGYDGVQPEAGQKEGWEQLSPTERADCVRKMWKFVEYSPGLKKLATLQTTIQTILTQLVGEPVRLIQDMAMLKPPFIGGEKPWHQDAAYFGWGPPTKIIGVWIALDAATAENGCMHVVPGSHRDGPVPHVHARDCQIPDDAVRVEEDVIVPLAPGGGLFFSALVHHGTPPNTSPNRRRALQFHYAAQSCTPISQDDHQSLFFDGTHYAGCRG